MLGGRRRARINRTTFWDLLQIDGYTRHTAVEYVLDEGAGRFYASAMIAVLSPEARYHKLGHLLKVPYTYYHKLAAMDSLVRLDDARALDGLIVALKNDDIALRQAAISCMGRLATPRAESALFAILKDERQPLRHAALQALADRWALPAVRRLASPVGSMVSEAALWLAETERPRVLMPVLSVLRDTRPGNINQELARQGAIEAVARLAERFTTECAPRAILALRHLLESRRLTRTTARHALAALDRIGTDDARAVAIVYQHDLFQ
jgi:HEAT repeat protein